MWGQADKNEALTMQNGIIPTRVGTRGGELESRVEGEDHPHACGDKESCPASSRFELGSSPRVWGQVMCRLLSALAVRIIPTRVGTSWV